MKKIITLNVLCGIAFVVLVALGIILIRQNNVPPQLQPETVSMNLEVSPTVPEAPKPSPTVQTNQEVKVRISSISFAGGRQTR